MSVYAGPLFTKMTPSCGYRNHHKPKTVWRPSRVHNCNRYTNKTVSSYWLAALVMYFLQEFDAFISYSHEDNQWVREELRPRLEDNQSFRLCIHDRDFVVGAAVSDNITSAVKLSRRMVLILSKAFLRSHWCQLEFKQAHYRVSCFVPTYIHIKGQSQSPFFKAKRILHMLDRRQWIATYICW